mgnify:CR=1 FL=1
MISALIMTMILTMIVHMIMNVLYSKAGKSFYKVKDSSKQWDRRKNIWSSSYSSSLEHSDCFMASKFIFCIFRVVLTYDIIRQLWAVFQWKSDESSSCIDDIVWRDVCQIWKNHWMSKCRNRSVPVIYIVIYKWCFRNMFLLDA